MVEPDHRSAEQQAGERPHRQIGPGTARALLWVLIPLQLGMVRVAERCRGCLGCIEPVSQWASGRGLPCQEARIPPLAGSNPSLACVIDAGPVQVAWSWLKQTTVCHERP